MNVVHCVELMECMEWVERDGMYEMCGIDGIRITVGMMNCAKHLWN